MSFIHFTILGGNNIVGEEGRIKCQVCISFLYNNYKIFINIYI